VSAINAASAMTRNARNKAEGKKTQARSNMFIS
jgi:hypothetical protein